MPRCDKCFMDKPLVTHPALPGAALCKRCAFDFDVWVGVIEHYGLQAKLPNNQNAQEKASDKPSKGKTQV